MLVGLLVQPWSAPVLPDDCRSLLSGWRARTQAELVAQATRETRPARGGRDRDTDTPRRIAAGKAPKRTPNEPRKVKWCWSAGTARARRARLAKAEPGAGSAGAGFGAPARRAGVPHDGWGLFRPVLVLGGGQHGGRAAMGSDRRLLVVVLYAAGELGQVGLYCSLGQRGHRQKV